MFKNFIFYQFLIVIKKILLREFNNNFTRFEPPCKRTSRKVDFADVYLSTSSEFPGILGICVIRLLPILVDSLGFLDFSLIYLPESIFLF